MDDYTDIGSCIVKHVTKRAILLQVKRLNEERWVPMSLVHEETLAECEPNTVLDEVLIKDWFAEKEGLE